ncbi:MAG TPA: NADH-quinone oxidoreductase subunit C [Acidimicrobiia bacterium]|jgi:NADH:ubiquinone oxidoreductase subunit C|nr:NADH-quinone oxidoreductase subunit C [Acidimicrobiia bacterium]
MADDTAREADHELAESGDEPVAQPIADEVAAAIVAAFEGAVFVESHGQPVVYVDRSRMAEAAAVLRDQEQFTMLVDTVVVDHLLDGSRVQIPGVVLERFEVVVNFLSHARNRRIRIVSQVPADDPTVPSLTPVYPGANFPERESYDLFGINFDGHPDLTRILMPDDWHGHPLRKDDAPARVPVTFKGDPSPR